MKKRFAALTAAFLMLLLLTGCGSGNTEIASVTETETAPTLSTQSNIKKHTVSNVDEFLAALNSNTEIVLLPGEYVLSSAEDCGKGSDNPAYYWENMGDGCELTLNHLHDLTIRGTDRETTSLLTDPRMCSILKLSGCKRITLEGFTAGHTDQPDYCVGGVLDIERCENITVQNMGLFGCGTVGVYSYETDRLTVKDCHIYDCSSSGIQAYYSPDLSVENCIFYGIGTEDIPADSILDLDSCDHALIQDCSITENHLAMLLALRSCTDAQVEHLNAGANHISAYAFRFLSCQPVFKDCTFEGNQLRRWYEYHSDLALNEQNEVISDDQLPDLDKYDPDQAPASESVHVKNVNELLSAIGPNKEIILEPGDYNLRNASDYGAGISKYYQWEESFDGYQLVITDVDHMTIRAKDGSRSDYTISAEPRYSNVLTFRRCQDVTLSGFTAGHTEQPGYCTGGVLEIFDCDRIQIEKCGLFGCGTLGVNAFYCSQISVEGCDIYDCSLGGIEVRSISGLYVEGNTFRDLGGPEVMAEDCLDVVADVDFSPTDLYLN